VRFWPRCWNIRKFGPDSHEEEMTSVFGGLIVIIQRKGVGYGPKEIRCKCVPNFGMWPIGNQEVERYVCRGLVE